MRLFPRIDSVLDEVDGVPWPPFTAAIRAEVSVPDTYVVELFIHRAEEVGLER